MGDHAGELQRGNTRVGITDGEHAGELQRVDSRRNHRGGITEADLQRRQHAGNCGAELQGWGTRIAEDEHAGIAEGEHTGE